MAKSCQACQDLQTDAPNFVVNGLGTTEITSLKNNTGLSPSNGNNDCTDLNNMNDCLIGNLSSELDAYDVCDWKEYTKNLTNNTWTMFGGIIAAICGLWTKIGQIDSIRKRLEELCKMMDFQVSPPVQTYGALVNIPTDARYGGTIASKSGNPVLIKIAEEIPDQYKGNQGVGIRFGKSQVERCSDDACQTLEWLAPHFYGMRVNPDVELAWMDELWSVDKATVLGWGMTQTTWSRLMVSAISWTSDFVALGTALFGVRLSIESDRLVLRYYGQIGADSNADVSGKRIDSPRDGAEALYRSTC